MIFNAVVAIFVLAIPVIWSTKAKGYGLFSAFLAAVCTFAAGAIAFAVWEPAAYAILSQAGTGDGFLNSTLQGAAWGLGLLVPFIVSMLVLRLAVDTVVGSNLDFDETTNLVGGLVFGAVNSVITVGILVISVGHMRGPQTLLSYAPIEERSGMPVYARGLWIPVDNWTTKLYEGLSRHAFGSSTPLADFRPQAYQAAGMQRMTFGNSSRNTLLEKDFEIVGRYRVSAALDDLLTDTFLIDAEGNGKKQTVVFPDGSSPSSGASLEALVIRFKSGAKERTGNIVLTPGQIRMLASTSEGGTIALHPIAVVAPPDATTGGLYRFRFDAPEAFIASQGGGSEAVFGFEFIVPQGATPRDILVRNTRVALPPGDDGKQLAYSSSADRDTAVKDTSIFTTFGVQVAGAPSGAAPAGSSNAPSPITPSGRFEGIEVGSTIPGGLNFNKTNRGPLEVNDENRIVDGEHTFSRAAMQERALARDLRVDSFATTKDTGIVKLQLAREGTRSLLGRSVETAENILPPLLIDDRGTQYEPVGFLYDDGTNIQIRFTPGQSIRALSEIPALSRTKRNQTLYLIYRVTAGVKLKSFSLGSKEVASFGDGVEVRSF